MQWRHVHLTERRWKIIGLVGVALAATALMLWQGGDPVKVATGVAQERYTKTLGKVSPQPPEPVKPVPPKPEPPEPTPPKPIPPKPEPPKPEPLKIDPVLPEPEKELTSLGIIARNTAPEAADPRGVLSLAHHFREIAADAKNGKLSSASQVILELKGKFRGVASNNPSAWADFAHAFERAMDQEYDTGGLRTAADYIGPLRELATGLDAALEGDR